MPSKLVADIGDVPDIHEGGALPAQPVILAMGGSATIGARLLRLVERAAITCFAMPAGYKLANDGQDTRAIQAYLGHRNIQNTTRYTALVPQRFKKISAPTVHLTDTNTRDPQTATTAASASASHHNHRRSPYTHPLRSHGRSHAPHTRVRHNRLPLPPTSMPATSTHGRQQIAHQEAGHFLCRRRRRLTG